MQTYDIVTKHTSIGCFNGCRFRLPDTQELETRVHPTLRISYTVLTIIPHCAISCKCAKRRQDIYDAAYVAANKAANRCKSLRGKLRARKREWDLVTSEYTKQDCPFWESA